MFALSRKKDQQPAKSFQGTNGRYVRVNQNQRGGYVEYGQAYPHVLNNNARLSPRGIPEVEISESYLTAQEEEEISKRRNKGNRRKIPFLQKKKKNQPPSAVAEKRESLSNEIGYDEDEDISDITTYDEGIPIAFEGLGINNVSPGQYKKTEQTENQYEVEAQIQERLNYIVGNYRPPPSYPGQANTENEGKSMIQRLLQEKNNVQIRDNASMINYCQVDAPKGLSMEDLTKILRAFPEEASQGSPSSSKFEKSIDRPPELNLVQSDSLDSARDDKLVMRTLSSPLNSPRNGITPGNLTPTELFERRNMYYQGPFNSQVGPRPTATTISEIYPRDYDADYDVEPSSTSGNPSSKYVVELVKRDSAPSGYSKQEAYDEHPERDYDLPIDALYDLNPMVAFSSHFREKSETFVPPSPYMYTDIPEWLQVYSKASPDLDKFLKWEMFRIPELDCWQTMLKRLYMKELEQVVLWFEEYRQSLQQEIERRERELGIARVRMPLIDPRLKKTDV